MKFIYQRVVLVHSLNGQQIQRSRNSVKQWLQEQNHGNPDDLIDGLVYHLSSKISQNHGKEKIEIMDQLEKLDPQVAANVIFGEYIKHEIPTITQFWGPQTKGLFNKHYLFGNPLSRKRIQELYRSIRFDSTDTIIIPMYIFCQAVYYIVNGGFS